MIIGIPVLFLVSVEKTLVFIPLSMMLIWAGRVEPFLCEGIFFQFFQYTIFNGSLTSHP